MEISKCCYLDKSDNLMYLVTPLCSNVSLFRCLCIPNVCMKDSGTMGACSNLTFSLKLTSMRTFQNIKMSEKRHIGSGSCPHWVPYPHKMVAEPVEIMSAFTARTFVSISDLFILCMQDWPEPY